jgi:hypothetical protein
MSLPIPSEKFIKHGVLDIHEKYNQHIHNMMTLDTFHRKYTQKERMEMRNVNSTTTPFSTFYTEEKIEKMYEELKMAECSICLETITNIDNMYTCQISHKFHIKCENTQCSTIHMCPLCKTTSIYRTSKRYDTLYDVYS